MKKLFYVSALVAALAVNRMNGAESAGVIEKTFQEGLIAEESQRDLPAAIRAYENVVSLVDAQRSVSATAIYRLGECYRKLNRSGEAVAQYQRLLRDFPGEAVLARLSRENLQSLGVTEAPSAPATTDPLAKPAATQSPGFSSSPTGKLTDEIARLEAQLRIFEGRGFDEAKVLALQQAFADAELAELSRKINEMDLLRTEKSAVHGPDDSNVKSANAALEILQMRIMQRCETVLRAQRIRIDTLKAALPGTVVFFGEISGSVEIPPGTTLTLSSALAQLKPNKTANLKRIRVLRSAAPGGTNQVLTINLPEALRAGGETSDLPLHAGDRVEVPALVF